ncbi:class D beta-lactamase [Methylobacterium currus]|nr:penicillin-binding transpeptidase domain-containing protein [Methylobacterium currus]UHC15027.1 class D beta-lactamase [Methylobacterium currus]
MHRTGLVALILAASAPRLAQAGTLCTIVMDAMDGRVLLEHGDCRARVTPASTFKIPLAVMGFDSGFLTDAHAPVQPYKAGDPDWGGEAWRQPTDPTRWLKYSVVWYSQRITHALGEARVTEYARKLGFGNADISGDPGRANGLDRAWIASSLQVSPYEQVVFLRRLVNHALPVSAQAMAKAEDVVEVSPAGGG